MARVRHLRMPALACSDAGVAAVDLGVAGDGREDHGRPAERRVSEEDSEGRGRANPQWQMSLRRKGRQRWRMSEGERNVTLRILRGGTEDTGPCDLAPGTVHQARHQLLVESRRKGKDIPYAAHTTISSHTSVRKHASPSDRSQRQTRPPAASFSTCSPESPPGTPAGSTSSRTRAARNSSSRDRLARKPVRRAHLRPRRGRRSGGLTAHRCQYCEDGREERRTFVVPQRHTIGIISSHEPQSPGWQGLRLRAKINSCSLKTSRRTYHSCPQL